MTRSLRTPTHASTPRGTSRWRLLERVDIADVSAPADVYLRRWIVIETPWFSVKVHHILRPDADRALHDHPWPFTSIILAGGYTEELPSVVANRPRLTELGDATPLRWITYRRRRKPGSIHRMRADGLHRIDELHGDCWTLLLCGRRQRDWGFSEGPGWWMPWDEYLGVESDAS